MSAFVDSMASTPTLPESRATKITQTSAISGTTRCASVRDVSVVSSEVAKAALASARICDAISARLRDVMSTNAPTLPLTSPASLKMGAALASSVRRVPSAKSRSCSA